LEDQIRMFMAVQAPLFEVLDLGMDVPASKFVEEAKRFRADIIALSALMTTTMPQQWV
jgi:5-methyltetrahydrofolate--homocysteine methyltransferase